MNRIAAASLLLLTSSLAASAQVFTAPFQLNGNAITTQSGTFGDGTGLDQPGANYSSFTVGAGTTINSSTPVGGNGINAPGTYLIHTSTANFTNLGSMTMGGDFYYHSMVLLDQGALSVNISNSGTMSMQAASNSQSDIYIESTTGSATVTNTGSLTASSGNGGIPIVFQSDSGSLSVTNAVGATIAATSGVGRGIEGYISGGSGSYNITNNGTITTAQDGIDVITDGSGAISVTNTGSITVTNNGILTQSRTGAITLFNSGTVNGGSVTAVSNAPINVTNTGTINGSFGIAGSAMTMLNTGTINGYGGMNFESYGYGTDPIKVTNTGSLLGNYGISGYNNPGEPTAILNSGTINVSTEGVYLYSPGTVTNSGTITAGTNAIDVPSGSAVVLQGHNQMTGIVLGGADNTSTSTLKFNLTISAANLAAARAQLNTEIADYATQSGGDFTFTVDGLTFDVSNFAYNGGVIDDLMASRLYAAVPGYSSFGTAIDHANGNTVQGAALINSLGNVPNANVANALAQLSPKSLQVYGNVAKDNNTFVFNQVDNHLANLRDGLTGFDTSGFAVNAPGVDPLLTQVHSKLLAWNPPTVSSDLLSDSAAPALGGIDMKDTRAAAQPPIDRWSSFISGSVILANLDNTTSNIGDTDYTTGNVMAGADFRIDDHFTVGAFFNYAHSAVNLDANGSKATVDSYAPGLYASYVDGGWYANGMAAYVRNAYTDDRQVTIPGLAGDNHGATSGNQATANLTGGYEFQSGHFKFGPVASLQYVHLSIDSMTEDGPTSLQINSRDQDSLRSLLGIEARYTANVKTCYGPMSFTPHASASWQHEYLENSPGITAQFTGAGGGSFTVQTDNFGRDSAFLDIGLDTAVSKNVTLFIDYAAQAGQDHFFAQSAQGGVRIGF